MNTDTVKLLGVLTATFPNHLSADGVKAYAHMLSDIPIPALQVAIEECVKSCRFFPSVAEIRERATPADLSAADAWEKVIQQIRLLGFYGSPKFDDPVIDRVVFSMDWQAICSSENPGVDRAQFMKMYDQMLKGKKHDEKLKGALIYFDSNQKRELGSSNAALPEDS